GQQLQQLVVRRVGVDGARPDQDGQRLVRLPLRDEGDGAAPGYPVRTRRDVAWRSGYYVAGIGRVGLRAVAGQFARVAHTGTPATARVRARSQIRCVTSSRVAVP